MSTERENILIISDLHIGGGVNDPGDDHIYQNQQFVHFIEGEANTHAGREGRLELYINGDFLEFAQVNQQAFKHASDDYWCSESESLSKLNTILAGHPDIFKELAEFQKLGNLVTIAAGNHDVDLYWPAVQNRLREVVGQDLRFELGQQWVERYNGSLQIAHGHMSDQANLFKHWDNPILNDAPNEKRLEMCPGTLFMVKFVNKLEKEYPFADNLLPVTKLASVLWHDDKCKFAAVGWMFMEFAFTTSLTVLGTPAPNETVRTQLIRKLRRDKCFAKRIEQELERHKVSRLAPKTPLCEADSRELAALMFALLGPMEIDAWRVLFDVQVPASYTLGSDDITLSALAVAGFDDGKQSLRSVAQRRVDETKAKVVVMGHTHQPDTKCLGSDAMYYNPGCWTRYLELKSEQKVTLDDLRDESRYPYQLNVVRVSRGECGRLNSCMTCFDRWD
ncbi:hypothetical protein [Leptothrix ochracea]|uniref:hypothetical protein n=1 Tax=Leptothrix ochracea TaxID=735331 RepID=UPI0034E2C882